MVMPMSSDPDNSMFQPFSWDLKSYEQFCMENYGVKPRPYWITSEYGGKVGLTHWASAMSNICVWVLNLQWFSKNVLQSPAVTSYVG
jgi:lysosomal Pro-X carboxypeptidase